jgi:RNA polymerase sigma-70 factor (sigma-E family)
VRDRDGSGFADFVVREQPGLLRFAVLLAGDRGHAEDLVQTALLKAYRHWPRISRAGDPTAYVRRVLVNTHTSWRRRLAGHERVMEVVPDRAAPVSGSEHDPALRAALQDLPPRMRAAVVLRFFADLTERETAAVLGCSTSAVNTQVARALVRLRQTLTAPAPCGPLRWEEQV